MNFERMKKIEEIGDEYFALWVTMCEISGEKYEVGDASYAFNRYSERKYGVTVLGSTMVMDAMHAKMMAVRRHIDE